MSFVKIGILLESRVFVFTVYINIKLKMDNGSILQLNRNSELDNLIIAAAAASGEGYPDGMFGNRNDLCLGHFIGGNSNVSLDF